MNYTALTQHFQGRKMAIPRRELVDSETPGFYHCISRCARKANLCGDDPFTGQNCDHRKQWIEKRTLELASIFAVELYAFAIMDRFLLLQNRHTVHPWT